MNGNDELVLYGYRGSGSAAIEAALVLAGLPYRVVEAASWDDDSDLAALKAANPLVQIPALAWPDGTTISESAAILAELGLRHPDSGLLPADPAQRAHALHGLVYVAANCYAAIGIIDYPERWCDQPDDATSARIRRGTRDRLHSLWGRFADTFPATPWLSGERIGALDLLAAVVSRWSGARQHLKRTRTAWVGVLERVDAHPPIAAVFERHWPASVSS